MLKKDKYSLARGSHSRQLLIQCRKCKNCITNYQKDGPGNLRRMYFDRFIGLKPKGKLLVCKKCKEVLGMKYIYSKEKRLAYKIFVDALIKTVISSKTKNEL